METAMSTWFGAAVLAAGLSLAGAGLAAADSVHDDSAVTSAAAESAPRSKSGPARASRPHDTPRATRNVQTRPGTARRVAVPSSTPTGNVRLVAVTPPTPTGTARQVGVTAPASLPVTSANVDLENWMAKLPGIDRLPLTALPIPGTHDSGGGSLSATSQWASTGINDFGVLTKFPDWLAKPVVLKWAKTQNKDLYTQFVDGIRYVDLRLSYEPDGQIYLEHGLRGSQIDDAVSQIARFANSHPKEVLLVNMSRLTTGVPTSSWTPEMHEVLVSKLEQSLGARMAPDSLGSSATLQDFWEIDKNIVLMYSDGAVADAHSDLWLSGGLLYQPWPNVASVPQLFQANANYLADRDPAKIWGLSGQTTPDTMNIVRGLLFAGPASIEGLMGTVHPSLQNWLRYNFKDSINLVTTDFYDARWVRGSFIRDVLASVDGAYIAPRLTRFTKVNFRN